LLQEDAVKMSTIILSSSRGLSASEVATGAADDTRLGRVWTFARARLDAIGSAGRLLALNDRLLRDAGMNRADLEYEALFWSPGSAPRRDC
jgi:uncharacterized protein YjiS (DUF1127 family)